MPRHHIEVSKRAQRDLRKITKPQRGKLRDAMDELVAIPTPDNLDIKTITGHDPFLRLRVGDWRIVYRPLFPREMSLLVLKHGTLAGSTGYLVERIVDRQYFQRVVSTLELVELN